MKTFLNFILGKSLFLLMFVSMSLSAKPSVNQVSPQSDLKIVVLSDIHVMAPELLINEGSAWTNYLENQRKLVDYSKPLFDEVVTRIKALHPDLVLISGDLTKDGEMASHQYVVSKLDELRANGIPTLVIPGNHDRGSNSNAVSYDGETTTPVDVATNETFATLYQNYGYGAGSARDKNTLSYSCEPIPGLVVIGIDSGRDGAVSAETINAVCQKAREAYRHGKQVIAMMHHPLIPHFTGVENFVSTAAVSNYAQVRNALADAGVRAIFTGHFHTSDIAKDFNADLSKDIYDVNTGSLISYPCDYRVATLSADMKTLNITTTSITELVPGDGFANTAKDRLHEAAESAIASKGTSYSMIAGTAADAYIYHAEGDEADNQDAQNTRESLINAGKLAKVLGVLSEEKYTALTNMANSMLLDRSNYGDTGRDNKTADRTLTITMPTLTESVTLAADGWSTYCSDRTLDLSKTEGIKGYIATSVSDDRVRIIPITVVPANTGFILNGTGASPYELYATDATADNVSGNLLTGTLTETAAPASSFALSTMGGTTGFYPIQTGLTIPAHKAYLVMSGSGAKAFFIDMEETGIHSVAVDQADEAAYTLQGIRVSQQYHGIVIKNGKLYISK